MKVSSYALALALGLVCGFPAYAGQPFPSLPNRALTPGVVMTTSADVVCHRSTRSVRNVTAQEKADVYAAYERQYGVRYPKPHGKFAEVDHLISLELGGANDEKNLWPEPWELASEGQNVGAHTKDKLENALHAKVCAGEITLAEAQHAISTDWIAAYRKYVGPLPKD